ncbi:MAG: trypsin-like peptidase domain-containing protein [Lachnospiraceae bacterium]|nr:trypsin-like peptidase domain-containing protein [Lachnospiraceae bacterium]
MDNNLYENVYENVYENKTDPAEGTKAKKNWSGKKVAVLALCCIVLGGAIAGSGSYFYMHRQNQESVKNAEKLPVSTVMEGVREKSVIDVTHIDTSKEMTQAEVYAANVNSTVGITTSVTTNYWGFQTTSAAAGSGFIITDDGYIVTNYHVIENSNSIKVSLYDGTSYEAELIGYDGSNDIAVLKVDAKGLTPVVLGDSDNLNVGDSVVAIGNPLGELTFSLTSGAVSALNREVTFSNNMTMDLIQTDCAINSGNSGGALFNLYGEVIGVTNGKYSSSGMGSTSIDNIGFAIPISHVKGIVESIIENGYIAKPYIGVTVMDVSEETQSYGLPKGAAVKEITEDSPASKAGLKENDIITEVNGNEIDGSRGLVNAIGNTSAGDEVTLTVYRQGKSVEIKIVVEEKVQSAKADEEAKQQAEQQSQQQIEQQPEPQNGQEGQMFLPWGSWFGNW